MLPRGTDDEFPQDPAEQLRQAIRAVFDSWLGKRAVTYRRINHIPDEWGTACNVQQMVFGNKGDTSCSGVAFSRDEVTGAATPSGDFLVNAQGEDVVSGARTPRDLAEMADVMPEAHAELLRILETLEAHYKDMQDTEFTVEEGELFMLQTRNAKRPAQAAVRFAVDAVEEGLLTRAEAIDTIDAASLDALLHPTFAPGADFEVLATGVAASPGAAKGQIVFTPEDAVEWAERGRKVILVRPFTEADDVHGFFAAQGILTAEGGKASHAALVARGMGKPCVAGASALRIDLEAGVLRVGDTELHEGDRIAIDGSTGQVTADDVPLAEPETSEEFETVLGWADELRRLGVRANADTPEDAARARELGAEGIGLCRTEHMFMAADRQPKMQAMIMAESTDDRRAALAELLPLQQHDFEGLFEAMAGLPVTIRLLDPPLHEFLPSAEELAVELERARGERPQDARRLARMLDRVRTLEETNPMLGTRGARLGIIAPEIYDVQVEAIVAAARTVRERLGESPHVEIMIPLVAYEQEVAILRARVEQVVADMDAEDLAPPDRHDDRAAARVLHRRPHRPGRRLLLLRHQRPHADRARPVARRRRVRLPVALPRGAHHRPLAVRDDRPPWRRLARAARRLGRPGGPPRPQARHLRRARRRSRLDRLLPPRRPRLRELLAVPRADRPRRRGAGRAPARPGRPRRLRRGGRRARLSRAAGARPPHARQWLRSALISSPLFILERPSMPTSAARFISWSFD